MRFVRARKSDITKAATMASDWAEWWVTPFADEELQGVSPSNILRVQEVDPTEQIYTDLVSAASCDKQEKYMFVYILVSHLMRQLLHQIFTPSLFVRNFKLAV